MSEGISRMRSWRFYYHYLCFSDIKRKISEIRRDKIGSSIKVSLYESRQLRIGKSLLTFHLEQIDLPARGYRIFMKTWEKSLVFWIAGKELRGETCLVEFYILYWFFGRVNLPPNTKIALERLWWQRYLYSKIRYLANFRLLVNISKRSEIDCCLFS